MADSHLGFDHPVRPKVRRRRRGHDFLAHHERVCRIAVEECVDLLVHGGDVFHRPRVPPSLVYQAFEPLKAVADAGIPVYLVPGNHERSRIPFDWLASHPDVHVFGEPETVVRDVAGADVAITGIPCIRRDPRARFPRAIGRAHRQSEGADLRLLVAHQAFEGAVVGPADYTFRRGDDVVALHDLPDDFAAVLAGHIHRSQVLTRDPAGRPCPVPVYYPGSLERTAFAERFEPKGFMVLEAEPGPAGGRVAGHDFRDLEARPMEVRALRVRGLGPEALERELRRALAAAPGNAVLRLEADGPPEIGAESVLAARRVRSVAPDTMNVDIVIPGRRRRAGGRRGGRTSRRAEGSDAGGSARDGADLDAPAAARRPVQGELL